MTTAVAEDFCQGWGASSPVTHLMHSDQVLQISTWPKEMVWGCGQHLQFGDEMRSVRVTPVAQACQSSNEILFVNRSRRETFESYNSLAARQNFREAQTAPWPGLGTNVH